MKHDLRWLAILILIGLAIFTFIHQAHSATRVWLQYGWLDNAFGSSAGIDQIAARAARIPGVKQVTIHRYWETQQIGNEMMAAPRGDRIVDVGYSCGANSATTIAAGLNGHRTIELAIIQQSQWCGGYPLGSNVPYAQETFASNCLLTLGFGCKPLAAGRGHTGRIVLIERPDLHPLADLDPNAQADVLKVIAGTAGHRYGARYGGSRTVHVVRYSGQGL
jgi:hypothetical protein